MATDEQCVNYARECVRLAGLATDKELREQLLQMALNWMAEAMHERCKDALKPASPRRAQPSHHDMVDDGAGSKRA
jgi:hypothetical protein